MIFIFIVLHPFTWRLGMNQDRDFLDRFITYSSNKDLDALIMMLSNNVKVDTRNNEGLTPLQVAVKVCIICPEPL